LHCTAHRKYHILKYEPVVNHPMLHHGVAYSCLSSDEAKVEALPNLGPYDRLKQGMLCEQFFMVSCHWQLSKGRQLAAPQRSSAALTTDLLI
jgi:hypothetical protein